MRSTIALSMASLILSPTLVSSAPVASPVPDTPSTYSNVGGQAPGGNSFDNVDSPALFSGIADAFTYNAGGGGHASSGDATVSRRALIPPGDSTGYRVGGRRDVSGLFGNSLDFDSCGCSSDHKKGEETSGGRVILKDDDKKSSEDKVDQPLYVGPPSVAEEGSPSSPPHSVPDSQDDRENRNQEENLNQDSQDEQFDGFDDFPDGGPEDQESAPHGENSVARPGHTKNIRPNSPDHDDDDTGDDGNEDVARPGPVKAIRPGSDDNDDDGSDRNERTEHRESNSGSHAEGGSVSGGSGLINVLSNNAGNGGLANSGVINSNTGHHEGERGSHSKPASITPGGSVSNTGGLINILSNNAGHGGAANSGGILGLIRRYSQSGSGGYAPGGSAYSRGSLISIGSGNAGDGGLANSGNASSGSRGNAKTGRGGFAPGGDAHTYGGLIHGASGNAGRGGRASSGHATANGRGRFHRRLINDDPSSESSLPLFSHSGLGTIPGSLTADKKNTTQA